MSSSSIPTRKFFWLVALGLAILYTLVALYSFDAKVQPYGDNTTYYILAKAMANGDGYREIHKPAQSLHYHFPPGYPAFMSLFMRVLGSDVQPMKVLNGTVLGFSILLLFGIGVRLSRQLLAPAVACVLAIFNPSLQQFGSTLMSEVLFLALTLVTLHAYLYWKDRPQYGRLALVGIALVAAFYVRSLGVAVLGGVMMAMLWQRQWKPTLAIVGMFVAGVAPWWLRNQRVGGSYTGQLVMKNPYNAAEGTMGLGDWPIRIWENFTRYLSHDLPNAFFKFVEATNYTVEAWYTWLPGILLLFFIGLGVWRMPQHRPVFLWSILGTCGILLLWPPAWFGVRFILPLVPLLTFFGVWGLAKALGFLTNRMGLKPNLQRWLPLTALILLVPLRQEVVRIHEVANLKVNGAYRNYYTAADWCRNNLPPDAVICTRKGSLFYLHADRSVTMFVRSANPQEIKEQFDKVGVTHVVLDNLGYRDVGLYLEPAIQEYRNNFLLIAGWEDPFTGVFQYFPDGIPPELIKPQP